MKIWEQVRLADFTTFRIGGLCSCLVECSAPDELGGVVRDLGQEQRPFVLIGGGSNLLISDAGLPELVVRFVGGTATVEKKGNTWHVDGSVALDDLVELTIEEGFAGMEFLSGIPGTVGGAVAGNAGAFGRQIADVLVSVEVLRPDGTYREASRAELGFGYRTSGIQRSKEIVLGVRLQLEKADRNRLREERSRILALRQERHPDWRVCPTAGSFFKNLEPTSAAERRQAAGWYLEQVGAKTMRVGRARVFEKHANIIIAEQGATSSEVWQLARQMAQAVLEKFRIRLEPEVRLLGSFDPPSLF